ncbi:MAG: hypothetical protein N2376_13230, partial [Clostridia bacterium]|nr:hypothetical protein [Clostridia bacterium]
MELVLEIGKSLILEVLQVAIGCLIGYVIFRGLMGKEHTVKELNNEKVLGIILASLLGLILPLGIFGIIPI